MKQIQEAVERFDEAAKTYYKYYRGQDDNQYILLMEEYYRSKRELTGLIRTKIREAKDE